ncbi:MAG: hypothetical protein R2751_07305 [Bacteroidales bacterium]
MSYFIQTDHELKLIRYAHAGILRVNDIGKAWEDFLHMEEFTLGRYNLLSDYRMARFDASKEDVEFILSFMYGIRDIVRGKKQALLLNDPASTALSMLFESRVNKEVGFVVKLFFTEKSALDWLTNP